MDWRCGSSGGVPALQAQSPEFKLQSHQEKETECKKEREKHKEAIKYSKKTDI
jgi:hypothetical protein